MKNDFIDTKKLAELTGTSEITWARRRITGDGPCFHRFGRAIRYRVSDVEAWLATCERQSTSEVA